MNKKRILSYVLTIGMVLGGSKVAFASEGLKYNTNVADQELVDESNIQFLSEEEVVRIAKDAMKYYLGKDTDCFYDITYFTVDRRKTIEVEIDGVKYMLDEYYAPGIKSLLARDDIEGARRELQYALMEITEPSTTWIHFCETKSDDDYYKDNSVAINAVTGEVLRVAINKEPKEFKGEVDKNKIKESAINFLEKFNLKVDEGANWDKVKIHPEQGIASVGLKVNGGKAVEMNIDLENYSVTYFYKFYIVHPYDYCETI